MKTIADLKRDLPNKTLILKERFGKKDNTPRKVLQVKTKSIVLDKGNGAKSHLDIPRASLIEYAGKEIRIYQAGRRDLTKEEKKIIENEPKDPKQQEQDLTCDTNVMFYKRKQYYKELGKEYLNGHKKQNGMRLIHDKGIPKIEDENIKGNLILRYEVIK